VCCCSVTCEAKRRRDRPTRELPTRPFKCCPLGQPLRETSAESSVWRVRDFFPLGSRSVVTVKETADGRRREVNSEWARMNLVHSVQRCSRPRAQPSSGRGPRFLSDRPTQGAPHSPVQMLPVGPAHGLYLERCLLNSTYNRPISRLQYCDSIDYKRRKRIMCQAHSLANSPTNWGTRTHYGLARHPAGRCGHHDRECGRQSANDNFRRAHNSCKVRAAFARR
jgi:hypothetical protein